MTPLRWLLTGVAVGIGIAVARPRETRKVLEKLEGTGLDRLATTLAIATLPNAPKRIVRHLAGGII